MWEIILKRISQKQDDRVDWNFQSQVTNQLRSVTLDTVPQRATDATYSPVHYELTIVTSRRKAFPQNHSATKKKKRHLVRTPRLIKVFTAVLQWTLAWVSWIQVIYSHSESEIYFNIILLVHLSFTELCPSDFPSKILHPFHNFLYDVRNQPLSSSLTLPPQTVNAAQCK